MLDLAIGPALVLTYILGHFSDYVIQSDWMANEKLKKHTAALVHALVYTLPFLLVTTSWQALVVICVSHFLIDRYRLARYVCWAKNFLAPPDTGGSDRVVLLSGREVYAREVPESERPTVLTRDGKKVSEVYTRWWRPWRECDKTGYPNDRHAKVPWMTTWLMIKADNNLHQLINFFAVYYLGGLS